MSQMPERLQDLIPVGFQLRLDKGEGKHGVIWTGFVEGLHLVRSGFYDIQDEDLHHAVEASVRACQDLLQHGKKKEKP